MTLKSFVASLLNFRSTGLQLRSNEQTAISVKFRPSGFRGVPLVAALMFLTLAGAANAQTWASFDDNTRYLALGDSLSAGFEAKPVTQGFVFKLYQSGAIDSLNNLLFCAAAIPNATSADVLHYQVPQAHLFYANTGKSYRKVITLTVGGNDALSLLDAGGNIDLAGVPGMIQNYANNLAVILGSLVAGFPDVQIYVGNLYDPKLPIAGADVLVAYMNQTTATVTGLFPANVTLVDIHSAFQGRSGLLLVEKKGVGFNVHPTDAGYHVMSNTFASAIK